MLKFLLIKVGCERECAQSFYSHAVKMMNVCILLTQYVVDKSRLLIKKYFYRLIKNMIVRKLNL